LGRQHYKKASNHFDNGRRHTNPISGIKEEFIKAKRIVRMGDLCENFF
jgi:hypothetical protein